MAVGVSNAFKQAMKAPMKMVRASISTVESVPRTISSADNLISVTIESDGYLFGTAMRVASIKLIGANHDLVGKRVSLKLEVQSGTGWEAMSLGLFNITEQTVNLEAGTTILKAIDDMGVIAKSQYIAGSLPFPCTVQQLAEAIATKFGLEIEGDVATLPNASYMIREDIYAKISNITYRDILAEIAGATATMPSIGVDGKLRFITPQKTGGEILTYDNLLKVKLHPKYGPINAIVLSRTPQEDNIVVLRDEASIAAPANRNILSMAEGFRHATPGINLQHEGITNNTVRVRASLNGQTWASASWSLPTTRMKSGSEYTFSYGKFSSNYTNRMLISVDCYQKSNGKRKVFADLHNPAGGSVKFTYEPDKYRDYQVKLFISKNPGYIGEFEGVYHDLYLAEASNLSGFVPFEPNGLTDVKLANNEILDDDRQLLAQPILDAVGGFFFIPFEATTEGHGWHEAGDRLAITDGSTTWETVITHTKLEIGQGIKEVISGVAPTKEKTDYARAGGIIKTIYNTEIKVDKQKQEIQSVVEKTTELDGKIEANHSQVIQNINNITTSIQATGGANLLYNSVGFATDTSRVPTVWQKTGTVVAYTAAESLTHGAKSGSQIALSSGSSIAQTVVVTPGSPVSLSARVKKDLIGQAVISISTNSSDRRIITIADQQEYLWQEVSLANFIPELTDLTIKVETSSNLDEFSITDLMLNVGDKTTVWQQASGEIHNTNVVIDLDGMIIKNSVHSGDYMKFTPLEIANYSNASGSEKKTFWLNRDLTNVQKLHAVDQISMPPIRIVPIVGTARAGWAFVKDGGNG